MEKPPVLLRCIGSIPWMTIKPFVNVVNTGSDACLRYDLFAWLARGDIQIWREN